jgi:peptide-methionine (S)-S-oxide reductase
VVQIVYEPAKIDYARLLEAYWRNIDPLDAGGQFCDRGPQYRSAIFVHDDAQRDAALAAVQALNASRRFDRPIVTEIIAAQPFYPAEAYHQDYYRKNPARYRYYRWRCGRDARLRELWGPP